MTELGRRIRRAAEELLLEMRARTSMLYGRGPHGSWACDGRNWSSLETLLHRAWGLQDCPGYRWMVVRAARRLYAQRRTLAATGGET